ncbi:MAG TPA: DUF302 domain-containing protein [Candidatus Methylomirabilis sp.]|nr:DUF302 domain-containing protein [Candidatus Methylomirabilis sp.]
MNRTIFGSLLLVWLMLLIAPSRADELLMVRAERPFGDAISDLQIAIQDRGYQVARIQRVDVGLASGGYTTAEYRLVFFGKPEEMRELESRHPEVLPYLPLKIVIFAEGDSTLALAYNPAILQTFFKKAALQDQTRRWEKDIRAILDQFAAP